MKLACKLNIRLSQREIDALLDLLDAYLDGPIALARGKRTKLIAAREAIVWDLSEQLPVTIRPINSELD